MKPEKFDHEKYVERLYLHSSRVEEELCKNPSWMGYYGSQAAMWQKLTDMKKAEVKALRGDLAKQLKRDNPKMAVGTIEAEVDSHKEYLSAHNRFLDYKEQADLFTQAHYALDKKQFSLQSLNKRNNREEEVTKARTFNDLSDEEKLDRKQRLIDAQR